MRGSFRPPGGRYKERRRPPPVDGPPRSVKERLDRRYDPRCDNLGDWAAAGGAVARPHTTAGVSVQRSLRLGAQKFSRVKRSAALAALARAEDQARLIEAEARSPPPKTYRAPRTTTRPATVAFTRQLKPVARAATPKDGTRPASKASERPSTAPEPGQDVENDADEEAAFSKHARDRWDAVAAEAAPAPEGWPSNWPRLGGEGWAAFPGGASTVDERYDGRAGFYRLLKECREAGDAAAFRALAAWTSGSAKYRDLVAAAERAGTGPVPILALRLADAEAPPAVVEAALEACHALAPHDDVLNALAKAHVPKRACAAITRAADAGEERILRHGCLVLEMCVRTDGASHNFGELFAAASRALEAATGASVEAACALVAALASNADENQLTKMLPIVPMLERVAQSGSKEKIYERQAANSALQKLEFAACPTVEELMAAPPTDDEDPAEVERKRIEAERDATETKFLETPGAAHARALVKACDLGGPGKAQLTLQEVELARSNAAYGDFVKWLLRDRAREFKRRAVEMALGITELTAAFADFQALMRAARLAREEAVQEVARRRDAAVDEAREAELERKRLRKERAEKREAALRKISPAEWAARAVLKDADDSGNGEVSKNELESCLARRSKFRAFVTWLLRDFRGRTIDLTGLTQQVRVYLREVHDDDALTAVARRPDNTYPSVTPRAARVSHDDSSLDGSIRIEISSR